ncbi:PH domain-containing protein [Brachybacterium squillarum]|uniref:PH domain-containing protein n=1 Tax=Brachybacterium squillarum TaxID=661979 RepID=UPI00026299D3|nr:PH domain-containing protein [Brachybacterium squillarum]
MTIPRQSGDENGSPRRALPDFRRSEATVQRMIRALDDPEGASTMRPRPEASRTVLPARRGTETALRSAGAALALGPAGLLLLFAAVLLWRLEDGHSPGLDLLMVLAGIGGIAALLGVVGLRLLLLALAAVRSRLELGQQHLLVQGALRRRRVAWHDVAAVESRVWHPVHGLTAALRLRDGSRVILPVFDRPFWASGRPSSEELRSLRRRVRRRAGPRP